MSKKKIVIIIFLFLLLFFNVFGTYGYYEERFITRSIVSKDVVIIDKYTIGGNASDMNSGSHYMKGQDEDGKIILIVGDKYNIGDTVTVYINENSTQANAWGTSPEWHTSVSSTDATSTFGMILFAIISIVNLYCLVHFARKPIQK